MKVHARLAEVSWHSHYISSYIPNPLYTTVVFAISLFEYVQRVGPNEWFASNGTQLYTGFSPRKNSRTSAVSPCVLCHYLQVLLLFARDCVKRCGNPPGNAYTRNKLRQPNGACCCWGNSMRCVGVWSASKIKAEWIPFWSDASEQNTHGIEFCRCGKGTLLGGSGGTYKYILLSRYDMYKRLHLVGN